MKYHSLVNKVRKVVRSCENIGQLEVAGRYSVLLICDNFKRLDTDNTHSYYAKRKKEEEIISWLKVLIRSQKVKMK